MIKPEQGMNACIMYQEIDIPCTIINVSLDYKTIIIKKDWLGEIYEASLRKDNYYKIKKYNWKVLIGRKERGRIENLIKITN